MFEGVVANGGFLTLTQCLIQDQNVTIAPITGLPVQMPMFSLKFDVKFSYWKVPHIIPFPDGRRADQKPGTGKGSCV